MNWAWIVNDHSTAFKTVVLNTTKWRLNTECSEMLESSTSDKVCKPEVKNVC